MTFALMLNSFALLVATVNIFFMLKIFSTVSSIAEAPRAWSALSFGLGMIVIHLSLNVFIWLNPVLQSITMQYISAGAATLGFGGLCFGVRDIYEVVTV